MEPHKNYKNLGKKIISNALGTKDHISDNLPPLINNTKGIPKFCPECKNRMVIGKRYIECEKCNYPIEIKDFFQCNKCSYKEYRGTKKDTCVCCGHLS